MTVEYVERIWIAESWQSVEDMGRIVADWYTRGHGGAGLDPDEVAALAAPTAANADAQASAWGKIDVGMVTWTDPQGTVYTFTPDECLFLTPEGWDYPDADLGY